MNVASIRRSKLLVLARIFQNSRSLRSAPRDGHGRGDDDGQTLVDSGGIPTAKPVACEIEFPPIGCGQWVRFVLANDREMITSVPAWRGKVLAAICVLSLSPFVHGFAALPVPLKSAPVTLAWNPANDPAVQGYGIYYGLTNQPATNYVNAGTNLTVTLFDLQANAGYRFYAVSYNAAGTESVPSNQLLLTPPVLSRVRIARLATGNFRLALRAAPGSVCQVECADTPDSSLWLPLGLATADVNGNVAVMDAAAPDRPARFYRVARLANPPPFTRLQLSKQPSGAMLVALNGSPGTTWEIQYTSSLVNAQWTPLTMVTANGIGNATVLDAGAAWHPSRFYRAVLLPDPPPFTRIQLAKMPNGSLKITLNGSPNTAWDIQYAASPVSTQWTTFATVTANATGEATVTNSPSSDITSRFYRAALP